MIKDTHLGINIDYSRDSLFDPLGLIRLRESYMRDDETSPQQRFAFVAHAFGSNPEHAQRMYEYASKQWVSFATPILSFGRSKRGLPISCFLPWLPDSSEGLVNTLSETNWLSMMGGGVGIGIGIRASDEKSTGVMPHLKTYDASCLAYRQGTTRRGSYAVYLDISHPDIVPFLEIRKPTGDPNIRCLNLHNGVNIPDSFMEIIERCMIDEDADDSWELICPTSGKVHEVVSAKELWSKLLDLRIQTGEPYIHYIDASNRAMPETQKQQGLKIRQSNLCTEIFQANDADRTAVCCLSSLNVENYDEWKDDALFVHDVMEFLDNVIQYFIDNAPDTIARAKYSAIRERSVGLGALGFHAYLQKHRIPLESARARAINIRIFKDINQRTIEASLNLGDLRGEAPDMTGTGHRFTQRSAVAPNASSSIVMRNTSPSIEPYRANVYSQETLSGTYTNKNRFLDALLREEANKHKEGWYEDTWSSIISNDGSVQHLPWMDDQTKAVFKTAMEVDQLVLVELAADRGRYITQGQSLNIFLRPNVHIKYLHAVHFLAWKLGLKSMYYLRSEKLGKADKIAKKIEREVMKELDLRSIVEDDTCLACEG